MNPINQAILESLRSSEKTAGELKDIFNCSYSVLDKALQDLLDAQEIEAGWSNDDCSAKIYRLKRQQQSSIKT
ncbi:hypothetical protein ANSO36C_34370 [Nostoc cf. commune SO-36]|uniref:Uncharacterized protein n=1 Tax=Nostoc cf. commune SO-36 TaxID=449208 RepID=A0ABN6Q5S8_NOSCO|nr:hypothetical protein [Nostoc commune]BDI17635.1 hypothetical protein ANSO36C_34370 [Nostoc cf. commune SO-36]